MKEFCFLRQCPCLLALPTQISGKWALIPMLHFINSTFLVVRSADEAEKKGIASVALQVPFLTTWAVLPFHGHFNGSFIFFPVHSEAHVL